MYDAKVLGLAEAERAVKAVIEEASKEGGPISVAVVDAWGTPISVAKMDGSLLLFVRMALNKAYTAATWRADTRTWMERFKESGREVTWFDDHRLTVIPGGVCIRLGDDTIVGGIGVSGRSADEDEALCFVGLKAIENML